jgi:peptide-methionine (S)-S-oxide reductase
MLEVITLGAGCFWCLDAAARRTPGIVLSSVGYAGGSGAAPSEHDLHEARVAHSGWVEAVNLHFDPERIPIQEILDLFFAMHDPTTANQDGANFGPAYHSTIFYRSDQQRKAAEESVICVTLRLGKPVVTSLLPFRSFVEAEAEHQNYYNAYPRASYCNVVIRPKLKKLGIEP